jgi:hypothetical protein
MSAAIALAERLHGLALAELPHLRAQNPERLFSALAAELPALAWQKVRVNPADDALARQHFPQAHVECDTQISGGMETEAEGGRIRVNNTLEARLETVWPQPARQALPRYGPQSTLTDQVEFCILDALAPFVTDDPHEDTGLLTNPDLFQKQKGQGIAGHSRDVHLAQNDLLYSPGSTLR